MRYKTKQLFSDPKTYFETAAIIVVIWYTAYAGCQSSTMNKTLVEIKKQTQIAQQSAKAATDAAKAAQAQATLVRQQLVGTQGAQVSVDIAPGTAGLQIFFDNRGIVNGKATFKFMAQRMTLPNETPIERSINGMFSATVPPVSKGGIAASREYSLPGYTPKTFDAMRQMKQTIKVEGDFTFDNGFGDIESSHVCQYWLTFFPPQ